MKFYLKNVFVKLSDGDELLATALFPNLKDAIDESEDFKAINEIFNFHKSAYFVLPLKIRWDASYEEFFLHHLYPLAKQKIVAIPLSKVDLMTTPSEEASLRYEMQLDKMELNVDIEVDRMLKALLIDQVFTKSSDGKDAFQTDVTDDDEDKDDHFNQFDGLPKTLH